MMLTSEVTVDRPPYFVWAYFTQPDNWHAWSRLSLATAHWEVGGRLRFEKNMTSTVDAIKDGSLVTFSDSWSEETWEFEPTPNGHTLVRVTENPKAMNYSDHGAAALAKTQASLGKFKAAIEATEDVRAATAIQGPVATTPQTP
jgi:uncharacterized protein YndB with AHSA1/START domain